MKNDKYRFCVYCQNDCSIVNEMNYNVQRTQILDEMEVLSSRICVFYGH